VTRHLARDAKLAAAAAAAKPTPPAS